MSGQSETSSRSVSHKSLTPEAGGGVLALLGADPALAAAFVDRELGAIERVGARAERLLTTLELFLQHGQRIANASAVSGRHRDTVYRHLREIEGLLGCKIETRSAELLWALRLRRELPRNTEDSN